VGGVDVVFPRDPTTIAGGNHMALAKWLFVLLVVLALAGCTSKSFESRVNVESYLNPDGNYGTYRTYGWVDYGTDQRVIEDGTTRERVIAAVEQAMESRGLKRDMMAPDLLIGYHGAVERQLDEVQVQSYYDESDYELAREPGKKIDSWEVGTLMLLVFDAKSGMMLWKATAQAELDEKRVSQKEQRDRITYAVNKMLETLPTGEDIDKIIKKRDG
jgi:hypothetical protein